MCRNNHNNISWNHLIWSLPFNYNHSPSTSSLRYSRSLFLFPLSHIWRVSIQRRRFVYSGHLCLPPHTKIHRILFPVSVPAMCLQSARHTHTINICILHEAAASRRKKFRFHNSQYKAINIFSVLKDFFFFPHLIPLFLFSFSVAAPIRYSIQFFRHIWSLMLVERFKVYFSYYLIRSVFVYVEKTWCYFLRHRFGQKVEGRYEIEIKMCFHIVDNTATHRQTADI